MSVDNSYNCFYPVVLQGLNNLVNAIDSTQKTSFKNFGRSELMGDVYIDNNARLAIGKTMDSTNIYYLDVSGNSIFRKELYTNFLRTTGALLIGNPANATQNLLTSLTIGSASPFQENADNPSGGISNINIQTKRGGTLTLGNGSLNNGGSITISAGSQTITIGGGNGTTGGVTGTINIGATSTANYNLITNLCTGTSANVLNLGSATSTINLLGNITANSLVITPTLISYLSGLTGNIQTQLANYQLISGMSSYALLASPAFTGNPTTTTQATADNSTRIASTAYVKSNLTSYAPLASPTFTGTVLAPTQLATDNSSKVATTGFVKLLNYAGLTTNNNFTGICNFRAPNDNTSISIHNGLRNNTGNNLNNVAIGSCLQNSTTSDINFGIGNGVLNSITSGSSQNMGIGYRSLEALTSGQVNIAIGFISGYTLTSGNWNTFFSVASGAGFSTGDHNFCMGFQTMASFNSPDIAKGTGVNRNLALGSQSITIVSSGVSDNVGIGFNALGNPYNTTNARLQGSRNTCIGTYAGFGLDGTGCNNNVFIGYNTGVADGPSTSINTNTFTNITAINTGVLSSPASNCVYIGNSSITNNYFYGTLNISNLNATGTLTFPSNSIADSALSTNIPKLNTSNTFTNTQTFANLTATGTLTFPSNSISDSALSTNIPILNASNTFTNTQTFNNLNATNITTTKLNNIYVLTNGTRSLNITNITNSLSNTDFTLFGNNNLTNITSASSKITIFGDNNLNSLISPTTFNENTIYGYNNLSSFTGLNCYSNSIYGINNLFNSTSSNIFYNTIHSLSFGSAVTTNTIANNVINGQRILTYSNGKMEYNVIIGESACNDISQTGQFNSNVLIGYQTGNASNLTSCTNCTFIGNQTNSSVFLTVPTTLSYVTCIGSGSTSSTNNSINLGRANGSDTTYIYGPINIQNQLLYGQTTTSSSTFTVSQPYYQTYNLTASSCTVTLPPLSSTTIGTELKFYFLNTTSGSFAFVGSGTDKIIPNGYGINMTPVATYTTYNSRCNDLSIKNIDGTNWYVTSSSANVGNIAQGSLNIVQQTQCVNLAYNSLISATTFNLLVSSQLFSAYSFQLTSSCVVTLPPAGSDNIGVRICLRRVSSTNAGTTTLTSASSNVYPFNSMTAGTTLLAVNVYTVNIMSMVLTGSTFGWFIVG